MDGVEILRARIAEETKESVENILSNARQQASAMLTEAQMEASKIKKEREANLSRVAQEREIQKRAQERLEARQQALQQKQDLLRETMEAASAKLRSYRPEERLRLYEKWLSQAGAESDGIIIAKKDGKWFPQALAKTYPNLEIQEKWGDFEGGFLLLQGRSRQDFRFEAVLEQNENRLQALAAAILFREEPK